MNVETRPDLLARFGDRKLLRWPTKKDLEKSDQLQLVVFKCSRKEVLQKVFRPAKRHQVVGVSCGQGNFRWCGRDVEIYNKRARRLGWNRRAVLLVCKPLRDCEKLAEASGQIVKSLFTRKDEGIAPELSFYIRNWTIWPAGTEAIYVKPSLNPPLWTPTESFAGMKPMEFLDRILTRYEDSLLEIRKRLGETQAHARPSLRVVGGKRGAA